MEKKDWRGDLLEIGEIPDGSEETVFVEFHLDTLNDFINKVVDKTREEGREELLDSIIMRSKIENCLYLQVAHCNKCGGESGYNIYDGGKVCFDCGEPYEADFSVSKVESTITTTNSQDQGEENTKLVMPPSAYEQAEKEGFDMRNKVKRELLPEDTPEEWEEKVNRFFYEEIGRGDNYIDVSWEDMDNLVERVKKFVQQLLEEREREVLKWVISEEDVPQDIGSLWASLRWHEIYKEAYNRLDKLNKEK